MLVDEDTDKDTIGLFRSDDDNDGILDCDENLLIHLVATVSNVFLFVTTKPLTNNNEVRLTQNTVNQAG